MVMMPRARPRRLTNQLVQSIKAPIWRGTTNRRIRNRKMLYPITFVPDNANPIHETPKIITDGTRIRTTPNFKNRVPITKYIKTTTKPDAVTGLVVSLADHPNFWKYISRT
jgi:hypothetical protein